MKNLLGILLIVLVAAAAYFMMAKDMGGSDDQPNKASLAGGGQGSSSDASNERLMELEEMDEEMEEAYDDRPAAQIYASAEDALKALREGAKEYDDLVLEQFAEPGPDCLWCEELYRQVRELMLAPTTSEDEKSYFAEVLAISGRKENIETLVGAIQQAGESEEADIFAEALELTIAGDDTVEYLGGFFNSENELLQESSVAAVTNQGSRLAAESLMNHTREKGDADGYYSLGIGVAELIPEDEALPYLHEQVQKRDEYSHLAVKALLNNGFDGLKLVMETLASSQNPEFDKKMLEDAIDHVSYEEEVETYMKKVLETSTNPVSKEFAKSVLDDFSLESDEEL